MQLKPDETGDTSELTKSVILMIMFPNGKIFICQDTTNSLSYFGNWDTLDVAVDFTEGELRDFTLRKQILWESSSASQAEIDQIEFEFILKYHSNDPVLGYNKAPSFHTGDLTERNKR